jgi:hypothetical protein
MGFEARSGRVAARACVSICGPTAGAASLRAILRNSKSDFNFPEAQRFLTHHRRKAFELINVPRYV